LLRSNNRETKKVLIRRSCLDWRSTAMGQKMEIRVQTRPNHLCSVRKYDNFTNLCFFQFRHGEQMCKSPQYQNCKTGNSAWGNRLLDHGNALQYCYIKNILSLFIYYTIILIFWIRETLCILLHLTCRNLM